MSRDQLAALVNGLGDLLGVLATAAPEDKAEVYRKLGLQLTYDPARRVVTVESHLGPDGDDRLTGGRRPGSGPTAGAACAPGAEPVGKSKCRRTDLQLCSTPGRGGKSLVRPSSGGLTVLRSARRLAVLAVPTGAFPVRPPSRRPAQL
ncbi:MAG: hypothetical protein ACRDZR_07115 [Acidimicrobiales bacterium]